MMMMLLMMRIFRMISVPVRKRFPTNQHLVDTGLLNENELEIIEKMENKSKKVIKTARQ